MTNTTRNYYEGMFLFPQTMAPRLQDAIAHLNEMLQKAGAEVIAMKKWGERPLAYPIRKSRRGLYLLTYFSCEPANMASLERDCTLSESLLRFMIMRTDHLTVDEMSAFDDRENLHVEARMRADQSTESASASASAVKASSAPASVAASKAPEAVAMAVASEGDASSDDDDEDDES